jgi:multicomponent Na+:H+ antiporter subunit C
MEWIAALTVGFLMAIGAWLIMDRSLVRVILGLMVLGNATNMLILVAGRLGASSSPFVFEPGQEALINAANPLPQALVLTAIVIGFGLIVFALSLLLQVFRTHHSVKSDRVSREAETPAPVIHPLTVHPPTPQLQPQEAAQTSSPNLEGGHA